MKQWKVITENGEAARRLRREAELSPVLARLLAARGLSSAEEAQAFLQGGDRFSPFSFAGMAEAAERIHRALDDFEGIAIYGDYDADGVTATAMLYSYLESCGANVTYYIPDREAEGYGLNCAAIDVLQERGASLIVTVDNGVSSIAEVEYAASLGIDVVVTDHHRPRPELPAACAVVDPHRADCPSGCRSLSGVGVAFELILALEGEDCDVQGLLDNYADLVCIGTIGDVVPLIGGKQNLCPRGTPADQADGSAGSEGSHGMRRHGGSYPELDQRGVHHRAAHQCDGPDWLSGSCRAPAAHGRSGGSGGTGGGNLPGQRYTAAY